jgi:hypothetical protein
MASDVRASDVRRRIQVRRTPIGIGNGKPPQYVKLDLFHNLGVLVAHVIVTQKMQETVHGKMGDMMGERLVLGAGLTGNGFVGQDDVADEGRVIPGALGRERQHVGGGVGGGCA